MKAAMFKWGVRIKRVMSGSEISCQPQSVTSAECGDTKTNKFNPCRDNNDGFWCEDADRRACFVIFVRSGEDIYYARPFPKWAMKRPIMQ